ncbi:MAG: AraC family transcriptional regulator [Verrucomicrobia bacterium]|nr:MAG: AraC family transcriptional regulator [Verrucomicrobiota bacterium]
MRQAMGRIERWLQEADADPNGPPFSLVHRMDVRRRRCVFTLGIPLSGLATNLPSDLESGFLPKCDVYTVRHIGAYRHLGNAWAAASLRQRHRVFRHNRVLLPFEVYETPPGSTAEANLVTTVNFPML